MKKKQVLALLITLGLMSATILAGCGKTAQAEPASSVPAAAESQVVEPEEVVEETITEEKVTDAITGIDDHTVVAGAEDVDFRHNILYDDEIVKGLAVDDTAVDLTTPGTYMITYAVAIDEEALVSYQEGNFEKQDTAAVSGEESAVSVVEMDEDAQSVEEQEEIAEEVVSPAEAYAEKPVANEEKSADKAEHAETEPDDSIVSEEVENAVIIEIKKEITVVDKEEAIKRADENEIVWDTGNETVSKSDGTKVEEPEPVVPKSNQDKGTVPKKAAVEKPIAIPEITQEPEASEDSEVKEEKEPEKTEETKTDNKSSQTSSTQASSTQTSAAQSSSTKPAAHTHTWKTVTIPAVTHEVKHDAKTHTVHHDAVTHEEAEYKTVSKVICNTCGASFDNGTALDAHQDATDYEHGGYHIDYEKVQTGSKTVTDSAAWDETIIDEEAWTETVVDTPEKSYQQCTGCGETK